MQSTQESTRCYIFLPLQGRSQGGGASGAAAPPEILGTKFFKALCWRNLQIHRAFFKKFAPSAHNTLIISSKLVFVQLLNQNVCAYVWNYGQKLWSSSFRQFFRRPRSSYFSILPYVCLKNKFLRGSQWCFLYNDGSRWCFLLFVSFVTFWEVFSCVFYVQIQKIFAQTPRSRDPSAPTRSQFSDDDLCILPCPPEKNSWLRPCIKLFDFFYLYNVLLINWHSSTVSVSLWIVSSGQ